MDSDHREAHFDIYAGLPGKSRRVGVTTTYCENLMSIAAQRRTPRTVVRCKQYFMHFTSKRQKNKYFQKNFDNPLDRTSRPTFGSRPTVWETLT